MHLEEILLQHESEVLEFKESCPDKNVFLSLVCAFANTMGGALIIGVEDRSKRVIGVNSESALEIEQRIASWVVEGMSPVILPLIRIVNYKGKIVICVHIDAGYQKPYRVVSGNSAGKVFVRIGSTTRVADKAYEEQIALQARGIPPDTVAVMECTKNELENEIIKEYLELRRKTRHIPTPRAITDEWLVKMRFAVSIHGKIKPTLGGLLLFNKNPYDFFDFAAIDMSRFRGFSARDFIDKATITGPLWKLYEKSLSFLRKHIFTDAKRESIFRHEKSAYPEIAFREFMVNAICHRVYTQGTGTIKLAVFDDIIEITNPGVFPTGLGLEDLGTGISVIRNPVIARAFNEIGLIEGWGTGIAVAQQELAQNGLPRAEIRLKGFFTQVSSAWRWPEAIPDKELLIVREAVTKGSINSHDVIQLSACSERTARNILSKLVKNGLLKKHGSTKSAKYTAT